MNNETSDHNSAHRLQEPETLLFETSPYGTLDAIVEHDGKSVYFYLNGARPGQQNIFGTRACWVRNLDEAPYVVNEDEMKEGIPPMMPRTHCHLREAQPIPKPEHLSVIWFEEGNGAALLETDADSGKEQTLAVIPPWSGLEGFHGYAMECCASSPLAWPMPDNETLKKRIHNADQFWSSFLDDSAPDSDPFSERQPKLLEVFDRCFGGDQEGDSTKTSYFAIDGGQFPPRGMVQYESEDQVVLTTVAMSLFPQPAVELFTDDPSNWRRIELGLKLHGRFGETELERIGGQFSSLASFPWRQFTWLGPGHTCNFGDVIPDHPFVLLVHDQIGTEDKPKVPLPDFRGDPVNLLWLIPITKDERTQLEQKSLTADQIVASREVDR